MRNEMRQELLKKLGEGFSKREVVKHIMAMYGVSDVAVYQQIKRIPVWAKDFLSLENRKKAYVNMLIKYRDMERKCSFDYLTTNDPNAKIGFLRTRLEILKQIGLLQGLNKDIDSSEAKTIELKWLSPGSVSNNTQTQKETTTA